METPTIQQKREKSKRNMGAFLGLLLGGTGLHFFYIGQTTRGYLQLGFFLTSIATIPVGIGAVLSVALPIIFGLEALYWLTMSKEKFYDEIQNKKGLF